MELNFAAASSAVREQADSAQTRPRSGKLELLLSMALGWTAARASHDRR